MPSCVIFGCHNCSPNGLAISYYEFPKNHIMRVKWAKVCGRQKILFDEDPRVCAVHFSKMSFKPVVGTDERKVLKENAVPFLRLPNHVSKNYPKKAQLPNDAKNFNLPKIKQIIGTLSPSISPRLDHMKSIINSEYLQDTANIGSSNFSIKNIPTVKEKENLKTKYANFKNTERGSETVRECNSKEFYKREDSIDALTVDNMEESDCSNSSINMDFEENTIGEKSITKIKIENEEYECLRSPENADDESSTSIPNKESLMMSIRELLFTNHLQYGTSESILNNLNNRVLNIKYAEQLDQFFKSLS